MLGQWDRNRGTPWFCLQAWSELFEGPSAQLQAPSGLVGRLWEEKLSTSLYSVLR